VIFCDLYAVVVIVVQAAGQSRGLLCATAELCVQVCAGFSTQPIIYRTRESADWVTFNLSGRSCND